MRDVWRTDINFKTTKGEKTLHLQRFHWWAGSGKVGGVRLRTNQWVAKSGLHPLTN
jgi:hypothetical protein